MNIGTSLHFQLKQILVAKSQEATQLTVVKKHLPDGSPFQPILQRHLLHEERSEVGPTLSNPLPIPQRRQSNLVKTRGGGTEYTVVHLGRAENIQDEPSERVIEHTISSVLRGTHISQEIIFRVGNSEVAFFNSQKEVTWRLLLPCHQPSLMSSEQKC